MELLEEIVTEKLTPEKDTYYFPGYSARYDHCLGKKVSELSFERDSPTNSRSRENLHLTL